MVKGAEAEIGIQPGDEAVYQAVESISPNPTTGRFTVYFSKALQHAGVTISNLQGSISKTSVETMEIIHAK